MRETEAALNEPLHFEWRSFPLQQVNNEQDGYLFWEQAPEHTPSLRGFLAAEAARDQGPEPFREFVFRLLEAIHKGKKRLQDEDTVKQVAGQVPGLDVDRLLRDMEKPEYRERIARDYQEASEEYGIFGTPTLLFPEGDPVFLKMSPPAPRDAAGSLFSEVRALSKERSYVQELKKPRRPERKG